MQPAFAASPPRPRTSAALLRVQASSPPKHRRRPAGTRAQQHNHAKHPINACSFAQHPARRIMWPAASTRVKFCPQNSRTQTTQTKASAVSYTGCTAACLPHPPVGSIWGRTPNRSRGGRGAPPVAPRTSAAPRSACAGTAPTRPRRRRRKRSGSGCRSCVGGLGAMQGRAEEGRARQQARKHEVAGEGGSQAGGEE